MDNMQSPVLITTQRIVMPNQDVKIDYPVVWAVPNPLVQQKINATILTAVYRLFYDQAGKLISQGYQKLQLTVQGWYEIKTNELGVLSLSLENYTFAHPAAHGLTIIRSLTFDIITGEVYPLGSLFKKDSNYVQVISAEIQQQIRQRNIPLLNGFTAIRPDQDYYIADKALVVYFQTYEITPYYIGLPMFPISVFDLQDIVKENGPLGRMATNG